MSREPRRDALMVTVLVAAVYGLTRSGNHSETEDSVAFAVRVRDAPASELLEGTHTAYLPIGRAFASVLSAIGLLEDRLLALQILDMILAAGAVGGLWLLLRRARFTRLAAGAACGTVAFSYAFWHNAVEAEVYALSAAALVAAFAAAWSAATAPSTRAFALLGVASGVAVLAHVTNVLFAFVAGVAVALAARRLQASRGRALRWGTIYTVAAAAIVIPVYALAAVVHRLSTPVEFWEWFTERSGAPGDFGNVGASTIVEGIAGSTRALVGGHFAFALEPIRGFLADRFVGKTFTEEQYFLHGFPDALASALIAFAFAAVVLVVAIACQWRRRPALEFDQRAVASLALAWLVPYAVLLVWWDPLNIELWYVVWLAAGILLAVPLDSLDGARRRTLAVGAVVVLFVVNLVGSVLPQRDESRDFWRAKAAWYVEHSNEDDLVVSNGYVWSAYLRYLADAEVVDVEDLFREAKTDRRALSHLRRELASARARVFVSGEAFDAFIDRPASCNDAPRTCEIAAVTARELRHECALVAVVSDPLEHVWRCQARSAG